nr:hypothetical protein [Tanacetum cinerariifolium]
MEKLVLNEARAKQYLAESSIECIEKYRLGEELLKELSSNSYSERVEEDVVGHIAKITKVLNPIIVDGLDPLEFITWRNSKFKDHKKVDETTKRALLYSWIEVGNNEGLIDEDTSSNDDRNQTNSSIITKLEIKISGEFLKILHDNSFNGMDGSEINEHIGKALEITKRIKIPNVDKDELRLHVFSKSLNGDAKKLWDNEGTTTN